MDKSFQYKGMTVEITYKRIKNIYLRIKDEHTLSVSCPRRVTLTEIRTFIDTKENWIRKQLDASGRLPVMRTGTDGTNAVWLAKEMKVSCVYGKRNRIEIKEDEIIYHLNEYDEEIMNRLFYNAAAKQLAEMIREKRKYLDQVICDRNHLRYPSITVRFMTSRWGSCTPSSSSIRISSRLIHFPQACLDYVLLHEYAHLLQANHSKAFWQIVGEHMPDYKAVSAVLKKA